MNSMRISYRICRFFCQCSTVLYLKARCYGTRHVPMTGGVLLVSNHQSFVDPVLVTMALHREGNYMARDTLFRNKWFRRLIEHLNAFPIRRGEADLLAIKETLRRLRRGDLVVVFPEGTRTVDGQLGPMRPGLATVAKKCQVPIIPTLIDGMYQAWPRHQLLPAPGNVIIEYGAPILPAEYAEWTPEELTEHIRQRLIAMQRGWHGRVPARRLEWFEPLHD